MQSIGLNPAQIRFHTFDRGALQHGMRKIRAHNLRTYTARSSLQSKRHIAGSTAEIEHASIRPRQNVGKRRAVRFHHSRSTFMESTWFNRS